MDFELSMAALIMIVWSRSWICLYDSEGQIAIRKRAVTIFGMSALTGSPGETNERGFEHGVGGGGV